MNYKTLIAFLGKNQMKDWSKPIFSWIVASDIDNNEPVWSAEFKEVTKKRSRKLPYIFKHCVIFRRLYSEELEWSVHYNNHETPALPPIARTYYSLQTDVIVFIAAQIQETKDKNLLSFVEELAEADYAGEQRGSIK
jgi:hypothetical protein